MTAAFSVFELCH